MRRGSSAGGCWRRPLLVAGCLVVALVFAGQARAGYAVGPASGSTTSPRPTFVVSLEPSELSLARVYVAATNEMTSYMYPVHELGSCAPLTPTAEQQQYSCQPSYYSPGYTSTLPPGTYYWWLSFYHTDPGSFFPTLRISGPLVFTVAQPVAPTSASLSSPIDGSTVTTPLTFTINSPAAATMHIYVSLGRERQADGSPLGLTVYHCSGKTTNEGRYSCTDPSTANYTPGLAYYWWAVIDTGDAAWVYGPRTFTVKDPYATPPTSSGGSAPAAPVAAHGVSFAPYLKSAAQYTGASIKQTRLSKAAYELTKYIGVPKTIAVACWSTHDWPTVSGDSTDGYYVTLGFYTPLMPHWVQLAPSVCRAVETLLHHRPQYANRFTANAVETLTHEMMHAIGITHYRYPTTSEAIAECFGMQLSVVLAVDLGVPYSYADSLAKQNLINYASRPPSYRSPKDCRENGAWDLFRNRNSPPWHTYALD